MQADTVREAIGKAAESVLETMFFTIPEGEIEPASGIQMLCARMNFSGDWSGSFVVETPINSAREIAANFLGEIDPAGVPDEKAREVISELANMVCGSTLSLLDQDKLFDLGSPSVSLMTMMGMTMTGNPATDAVARAYDLGNGSTIRFALHSGAIEP